MNDKTKKGFLYFLNPIIWIRSFFSYLLTIALFINHFFIFILIAAIVILVAFFSYDRYATMTYDGSTHSAYMGGAFSEDKVYKSPLVQGNKGLMHDLSSYYAQHRKLNKKQPLQAASEEPQNEVTPPHSSIQKEVRARMEKEKSAK